MQCSCWDFCGGAAPTEVQISILHHAMHFLLYLITRILTPNLQTTLVKQSNMQPQ